LLWNNDSTHTQFGLKCDYRDTLLGFCRHILEAENLDILLVPHVNPRDKYECDQTACRMLKLQLPKPHWHRIHLEQTAATPSQLKTIIANTCWFTGARMHATIAALSSGVAACNMAYSACFLAAALATVFLICASFQPVK